MKYTETKLKGCFVLEPNLFEDNRGHFFESYNKAQFDAGIGAEINFVQDNQSFSVKGVIRAIHYQIGKHAQAKLVRVLHGTVLDVAVDLRKDSPTFGEHFAVELSHENKKQLFIPKGFGHGFSVLSDKADFFYKCDNYYNKSAERGIIYNDAHLAIDWKVAKNDIIISEKDMKLLSFKEALI
ncbi:dTDP-4-dehydrorhamnose 3,5-epimerase [Maribacter sp. R77961]|uniref:dTDP-4-dehydrorhamnose 3,5-epimerase n=1 Tax=Maribacter sp. R77961 TaxID=3093871 RepID=UPI0037C9C1F7